MSSSGDLPLEDSDDPEATLPFRAVVALPGQSETVEPPPVPQLTDPARAETRDEDPVTTLPFGSVLSPAPSPREDDVNATVTVSASPPSDWRAPAPAPPAPAPLAANPSPAPTATCFAEGVTLEGSFLLEGRHSPDPRGEWWIATHPQFGPCLVLVLGKAQAAAEGPRLLIGVRVAMGVPPDPRLELPIGAGGLPGPWVAFLRQDSSSVDEILRQQEPVRALPWARDLAGGLVALHSYGVAHGHVSATTARIPTQGAARWGEIGLATQAGPAAARAPELRSDSAPTRGGDVYAFGALLSVLATALAEPPHVKAKLMALAQRAQSEARPSASELLRELVEVDERPPRRAQQPWFWGLVGSLVGALAGAAATWLALGAPR